MRASNKLKIIVFLIFVLIPIMLGVLDRCYSKRHNIPKQRRRIPVTGYLGEGYPKETNIAPRKFEIPRS